MPKRLGIKIYGQVQGVGFRYAILNWAEKLNLTGNCQNSSDGTVEIQTEGAENNLKHFLELCRQGPRAAQVEKVETNWGEATGEYSNFNIK